MTIEEAIEMVRPSVPAPHGSCGTALMPLPTRNRQTRWTLVCKSGYGHGCIKGEDVDILREASLIIRGRSKAKNG